MIDRILAVDLGKRGDSPALIIMDLVPRIQEIGKPIHVVETLPIVNELHIRFMERPELGTSYVKLVDRIEELMKHPDNLGRTMLAVDQTGIGDPVCDFIRQRGIAPIGISITSGATVKNTDTGYNVPKEVLVTALQLAFQSQRLKIAKGLKDDVKNQLIHELKMFTAKIKAKSKTTSYEAAKEEDHDDLVMAIAIAVWLMNRFFPAEIKQRSVNAGKKPYNVLNYGIVK